MATLPEFLVPEEAPFSPDERGEIIRRLLEICAKADLQIPSELQEKIFNYRINSRNESSLTNFSILADEMNSTGIFSSMGSSSLSLASSGSFIDDTLAEVRLLKEEMEQSEVAKKVKDFCESVGAKFPSWELRIVNGSYNVTSYSMPSIEIQGKNTDDGALSDEETPRPIRSKSAHIPTVSNTGCMYQLCQRFLYFARTGKMPKPTLQRNSVLGDINLTFESGKIYLVLGAPGSGKSSLLKYISNLLQVDKNHVVGGSLLLNGIPPNDKHFEWSNLTMYVDQLDQHHEYLTVKETLEYAFNCRVGNHALPYFEKNAKNDAILAEADKNQFIINIVLEALGLKRVKDTFVGNDVRVRGVSGGERRRVTLAELLCVRASVFCLDEISTGLDAATTYDICKSLALANAITKQIRVVSLLAPPPETAALFDELILIDEGKIIYSGPIKDSLNYFASLGYTMPARADPADWLLTLLTKDGAKFRTDTSSSSQRHLSSEEFAAAFESSERARFIREANSSGFSDDRNHIFEDALFTNRYKTSWLQSLRLVTAHEFLLWTRDRQRLLARLIQTTVMGLVIGTVFYKQADYPYSGMGVLYQTLMYLSLGSLPMIMAQVESRSIFYKHQERNFHRTWIFAVGRSIATVPAVIIDIILYGVVVFFLSGMAYNDGASIANFFVFLLLLFLNAITTGMFFSVFSAISKDRTTATALMTLSILMMVLFSGFTVQPTVIPSYWIWFYWINYLAWMLRAVLINQYGSGKFGEQGDIILKELGFVDRNGDAYQYIWVWWAVLFACATILLSLLATTIALTQVRFRTTGSAQEPNDDNPTEMLDHDEGDLPFQPANITFTDVSYSVKSSISNDTIELLKGVDGYFVAGKMTALMGSSGAGKTTLMDVLALRKTSGELKGEIRLNGHLQNSNSFRRCTGYVEQFDFQSAQLTVKETIMFSSKMRLDRNDPVVTEAAILKFVDKTMKMLELHSIQDLVVGSGVGNGLSFEQKKRLGIAVEVAANPSILFLDEPTSGLDSSAAAIVMKGLKRIADSGRAVCATIHQPSVAIFNSFDNLLLLKRGGEVVFFGELGHESKKLIDYFEHFETTRKIRSNENPATWMLNTIGSGTNTSEASKMDYALAYDGSRLHRECLEKISEFCALKSDSNEIHFSTKYANDFWYQAKKVYSRLSKVYWRSPSYNRTRLIVGAVISLLFGSVYASQRVITSEIQLNSICNSIYISVLFLGVSAYGTVLPFFEQERNMFYRHKAVLMYDHKALTLASLLAETPFICLVGMIFSVCFYFPLGFEATASKFFLFYFFVTANVGLWTFLGQVFISLFRDAVTAQGFGSLFVGISSLFAGILIAPQSMSVMWIWAYWAFPLHYVVEGLIMSQYASSELQIEAVSGSGWYVDMGCSNSPCHGSPNDYLQWRFGGFYSYAHIPWDALYLVAFIVATKYVKMVALHHLNFLSK